MSACEDPPNFERGLVGTRDEHDVRAHDVADRAGEQRVVRATEHERVDAGLDNGREQPLGEDVHLIGVDVAGLDELDEPGHAAHVSTMSGASSSAARWYAPDEIVPTVPITPTRPRRRDLPRGPDAGRDHADDGDVDARLELVERGRGRAVARDDEHLDARGRADGR